MNLTLSLYWKMKLLLIFIFFSILFFDRIFYISNEIIKLHINNVVGKIKLQHLINSSFVKDCNVHPFRLYSSNFFQSYSSTKFLDGFPIVNFDECPLCKFIPRNYKSNSSPRDVLITSGFHDFFGFISALRTLRTTGCKAQYIIFSDEDTLKEKLTTDSENIYKKCGAHVIKFKRLGPMSRDTIFTQRLILIHNFLYQRMNFIDRVIAFDMFDTVFQGDPFTTDFTSDTIFWIKEITSFHFIYNERTYNDYPIYNHKSRDEYNKQSVINGGTTMGGVRILIRYLEFYLDSVDYYGVSKVRDQDYLNRFINTGALDHCEFNYKLLNISTRYVSACRTNTINFDFGNYKPKESDVYPLLVHQFDDIPNLRKSVALKCSAEGWDIPQYIRRENGQNTIK